MPLDRYPLKLNFHEQAISAAVVSKSEGAKSLSINNIGMEYE